MLTGLQLQRASQGDLGIGQAIELCRFQTCGHLWSCHFFELRTIQYLRGLLIICFDPHQHAVNYIDSEWQTRAILWRVYSLRIYITTTMTTTTTTKKTTAKGGIRKPAHPSTRTTAAPTKIWGVNPTKHWSPAHIGFLSYQDGGVYEYPMIRYSWKWKFYRYPFGITQ